MSQFQNSNVDRCSKKNLRSLKVKTSIVSENHFSVGIWAAWPHISSIIEIKHHISN